MAYKTTIEATFANAEKLGVLVLPTGTRLIGHVPHVAPEAYLHVAFAGLTKAGIAEMEAELNASIPAALRTFYLAYNGLDVFSSSLAVHGLRRESMDDDEANIWLPFSISLPNVDERPPAAPADALFFGSYSEDGSLVYVTCRDECVVRCANDSATPLTRWQDLDTFLVGELQRLSALFDAKGKKRSPRASTLPVSG